MLYCTHLPVLYNRVTVSHTLLPITMTYFATHHTLLNMDNATYNSPQTQFNFANCNTTLEVPHVMTLWYLQIKHSVHTNTQQTLHGAALCFTRIASCFVYQLT